jgi:hypothetical protein
VDDDGATSSAASVSALHRAAESRGAEEASLAAKRVESLLAGGGAGTLLIDARNGDGETALWLAARECDRTWFTAHFVPARAWVLGGVHRHTDLADEWTRGGDDCR